MARTILDDIVTTIFPADCRCCFRPLLRASSAPICDACAERILPQTVTLCRVCGEATGMESDRYAGQFPAEGILCAACRFLPPPFEQAVAYGTYEGELREMIHLLKYERMPAVARSLGPMLAAAISTLGLSGDLMFVAVPLFPSKQRQRGYNQAELLARAAAGLLKKTAPKLHLRANHGLLRRVRDTESQFALSPKGRRRNLQGAFLVDATQPLAGRTVLLVDDIYTTGATARECARVLRRAGAGKVFVATLSRAQAERVAFWEPEGMSA